MSRITLTAWIEEGKTGFNFTPDPDITNADAQALVSVLQMGVSRLQARQYREFCEAASASNMKQPETPEAPQGDLFGGSDESL